jgi:NitT/TauT family transport system permease protein
MSDLSDVHATELDDIQHTLPFAESIEADHAAQESLPGAGPAGKQRSSFLREVVGPVVVFGLFLGFWYLAHYVLMGDQRRFLVPPPHRVLSEAVFDWDRFQPILEGLWQSTKVAAVGLAIAMVVGIALATVMSQASWIEKSVYPYLVALQAVPILAIVPLIGILFGFGFNSRVFVCVLIALFPIVSSTLFGLLSADRLQHELFTLQGVSRSTRLRKLQFPAAMPAIFTGFRISAGLSVVGAIVGDFLFTQGDRGIGQLINLYRARLQTEEMFAALILACLLGVVVFWLFGFLSKIVVGKWYEPTRIT